MLSAQVRVLAACCFLIIGCTDSPNNFSGDAGDSGTPIGDSGSIADAAPLILEPQRSTPPRHRLYS